MQSQELEILSLLTIISKIYPLYSIKNTRNEMPFPNRNIIYAEQINKTTDQNNLSGHFDKQYINVSNTTDNFF
jgi:hypothetical protein